MSTKVERRTVDLSQYPEMVVIYLGMRVNRMTGLRTLLGFGPRIAKSVEARPDGLLLHENFVFSLFPMHAGMRQYWRDMESLLKWTRSEPHRAWWKNFLKDSGGTGFWHETYLMRGGMEAIYDDVAQPIGFLRFAPVKAARGGDVRGCASDRKRRGEARWRGAGGKRGGVVREVAAPAGCDQAVFIGADTDCNRAVLEFNECVGLLATVEGNDWRPLYAARRGTNLMTDLIFRAGGQESIRCRME